MTEQRLERLEIQLAFQDDLLEALNRLVTAQQREISNLQREVRTLHVRMQQMERPEVPIIETPPPHY
ncbi:MAG: SlyX family protein [Pseudomonadales bacterium]|nr:SlyX family protein [Pseudomonadales bacterium]